MINCWFNSYKKDSYALRSFKKSLERIKNGYYIINNRVCLFSFYDTYKNDKNFYYGFASYKNFYCLVEELNSLFKNIEIKNIFTLNFEINDRLYYHERYKINSGDFYCNLITFKFSKDYTEESKKHITYLLCCFLRGFSLEYKPYGIKDISEDYVIKCLFIVCNRTGHNFCNSLISLNEFLLLDNPSYINEKEFDTRSYINRQTYLLSIITGRKL